MLWCISLPPTFQGLGSETSDRTVQNQVHFSGQRYKYSHKSFGPYRSLNLLIILCLSRTTKLITAYSETVETVIFIQIGKSESNNVCSKVLVKV